MKILRRLRLEQGMATFIALMVMLMMSILGLAVLKLAEDEITIAGNELNEMSAFYASEAGLEKASAAIQSQYDATGAPPTKLPAGSESINDNVVVTYVTTDLGAAVLRTLTYGSLAGLKAQVKTYQIESIGTSLVDGGQMRLIQNFESANVPIFQWAVFFMQDLWAQPVFDMSIDGRVHVNGDMRLRHSGGSSNSLAFLDKVTCAGNINHGFGYGDDDGGDVLFANGSDSLVSMKQDGNWVDANDGDWYNKASTLWESRVRDQAFGQDILNLPLSGDDPRKIIERADADGGNEDSFENKAALKIIDGVPYTKVGSIWQDISGFIPSGTITCDNSTVFYDAHEKKYVRNTQIDISKLKTSGYFPANGVVYVSDQRSTATASYGTVVNTASLVNGSDVGRPLTIASENPMYVQGDFNSTNKQPVAAIADAVTYLSNEWDPSKSGPAYSYKDRPVKSQTTVNMAFITGDLKPEGTNYGGGLENLPRFLEHWNGKTFKFRGSMIEGWRSKQATGTWRYIQSKDAYYSAPMRDWGFDIDFNDPSKLPPETPCVRVFQRTSWSQQDIGYIKQQSTPADSI